MTFLDVLVDGEIVLEAMLVDREAEEIIYKGPHLARRYHNIASNLIDRLPTLDYCVLTMPNRKYLIIPINEAKYLMLGLSCEVKAEDFIVQINRTLKGKDDLSSRKDIYGKTKPPFL
jgi:hypothetical protein